MAIKNIKGVILPRHDIEENWVKAVNFIPAKGELIVYDADTINTKVRFKFGDGVSNINNLDFASSDIKFEDIEAMGYVTQEWVEEYVSTHAGEGGGVTKEWVENYVDENTGAIVYLSTKEHIGENIELQDVYPIQHNDAILKVVSKNRITYYNNLENQTVNNVSFTLSNSINDSVPYFNVSSSLGGSSGAKDTNIELGESTFDIPGKYTISLHNNSGYVNEPDKCLCYIKYELLDSSNNIVQSSNVLTLDPVTIDTRELNCYKIKFTLYFKVYSGQEVLQPFWLQMEYGEHTTQYSHPRDISACAGKTIDIYGRNLVNPNAVYTDDVLTPLYDNGNRTTAFKTIPVNITINDDIQAEITNLGVHYFKGVMKSDNDVKINDNIKIKTPLLKDDKFTFIFNIISISDGIATISDPQIVYGYTDYEEYLPYEIESVVSGEDGVCNIGLLKYPYSLISIHNFDSDNDGLAIYIRYDPALSRDWTEKQLNGLNNRIKQLEEMILNLTNN